VKTKKVKIAKEEEAVPTPKAKRTSKVAEEKPAKVKKAKAVTVAEEEAVPTSISKSNVKEANGKKKSKALVKAPVEEPAFDEFSSSDEDEINIADQTAALLAGFDSSSEESDQEDALALDQVPEAKISKKERKALAAAQNDEPGTIYVGYVSRTCHYQRPC
jgi:nucleolar protein 15